VWRRRKLVVEGRKCDLTRVTDAGLPYEVRHNKDKARRSGLVRCQRAVGCHPFEVRANIGGKSCANEGH